MRSAVWGLLAGLLATQMAGAQVCDRPDSSGAGSGASHDLYCLTLVAVPGSSPAIAGHADLGRVPGPFTVAVTADGRGIYDPAVTVTGLPAPESLGPYTVFVAWVTPPTMYPAIKLGVIANGTTRVQRFALDPFIILITAEANAGVTEPGPRVVLRAGSPSTRLLPPDMLQFVAGGVRDTGGSAMVMPGTRIPENPIPENPMPANPMPGMPPGEHAVAGADTSLRWTGVPMPPGLAMVPGEMVLRPRTAPLLPDPAVDAPDARPGAVVRIGDGDTLHLTAGIVSRSVGGQRVRVYAYNGQYPGPEIVVRRGATMMVVLANHLDQPTTIHWHGIRLDAASDPRNDGVADSADPSVPPGGRFVYRVHFPDAGIYWYHPHVREDLQQNLGLAGAIVVEDTAGGVARRPEGSAGGRAKALVLSDLLMGDHGLVPFGRTATTHALMGRFGNVFLVNGTERPAYRVQRGDVVRFRFINAANARTFNVSVPGARMKLVGSGGGPFEHEEWVESVVIGPAERYIADVQFRRAGRFVLVNRVRALDHFFNRFFFETDTLATVDVASAPSGPREAEQAVRFTSARTDAAATADIERYVKRYAERYAGQFRSEFGGPPDRTLELTMEAHALPFVTRMLMQLDSSYFAPVEWTGTMPGMNWAATTDEVRWVLRDPSTGRENMDIGWHFARGSLVKLRLVNQRLAFHAMQHPIHIHGQRFLVVAVNGIPVRNLAWKDTVLVPAGGTVDLLVDLSNPGRWMLHCHIAEHLAAQMMTEFTVQ